MAARISLGVKLRRSGIGRVGVTQVIGVVTRRCAFQASDRLLSRKRGGEYTEFDPRANKAIVFRSTDADVLVGYSGRAYLDQAPTDRFIAERLLGHELNDEVLFARLRRGHVLLDIGRAVERLRSELDRVFLKLPATDCAAPKFRSTSI